MQNHQDHSSRHHEHHNPSPFISEIDVRVDFKDGKLMIRLEDDEGNPPVLAMTHEKMMHLIVVSNDLREFYHLHPEKITDYEYYIESKSFASADYTAFVDINPNGKNYRIIPIKINNHNGTKPKLYSDINLKDDKDLKKEIDGIRVELKTDNLSVGDEVTLSFAITNAVPSPYLGALGHVVILDESIEQFLHVHPVSDDETIFKTQFSKKGFYKLWAEFKFDEKVLAFPFVLEVQ